VDILALFQSVWTIVVMVVFLAIVVWTYNSKRKSGFEQAAHLPLDDDDSIEATIKEKHYV